MDLFLVVGIVLGLFMVIFAMVLKGASIAILISPEAMLVIFVGIIAATINAYPSQEIKRIPKILKVLFRNQTFNNQATIKQLVELSNIARRNGLLALEEPVQQLTDPFMKKGLEMVVDGVDADHIRETLENEISGIEERHHIASNIFKTAGSTSPTLGVMGAVIGLIGALGNLNNVTVLGESISAAFVATLYGIFFGYVILIPAGSRLAQKSEAEVQSLNLTLEGILAIQSGQMPKSIEQKLLSLLPPQQRPDDSTPAKEED